MYQNEHNARDRSATGQSMINNNKANWSGENHLSFRAEVMIGGFGTIWNVCPLDFPHALKLRENQISSLA